MNKDKGRELVKEAQRYFKRDFKVEKGMMSRLEFEVLKAFQAGREFTNTLKD